MKYVFTFLVMVFSIKTFAQAPANDEPCGATTLSVAETSDICIPNSANINVANITYAPNIVRPTSCNPSTNTNPDIWFKFTTPSNLPGGYKISMYYYSGYWSASSLAYIEVYDVTACNGTYYLRDCWSIDANLASGTAPHVVSVSPNYTYYVRVTRGAFDSGNPNIKLCITTGFPPPNAKIGINNTVPVTNFDVAGTARFRDNVGIGTSTPNSKLDVVGSGNFAGDLTVGTGYYQSYINQNGVNTYASTGDKFIMDWRYNGLKTGIGYYANPAVRGSNMLFYSPSTEDNFIFGRGDPFYSNGTYFTEWMRLQNDGKLGIGTPAPDTKLHVVGNIKMVDGNQALNKVLTSDANGVGSWQSLPASTPQVWTTSGNNIYNNNAGNVGIGTNTPGFPLNFANAVGDKISLYGQSGNTYGFGIQGGLLQIHTSASGEDIAFGFGSSAAMTERMRIKGNGNVGIGINNPLNPLSFPATLSKKISLYPGATGDVGFAVFGNDLRIYSDNSSAIVSFGFDNYTNGYTRRAYVPASGTNAMVVEGNLLVNSTTYTSDARYKTAIQTLPNALQNLLSLRGTSYFYNVKAFPSNHFSENKQLGVIAQEVEKIYPELVTTDAEGYKSVNYVGLIPVMIEAIKELKAALDTKTADVDLLKKEFAILKASLVNH